MIPDDNRMPRGAAIEEMLVAKMRADLTRPRWWQTITGRIAIGGGALLLMGTTAVAGVILLDSRHVDDTSVVHCLDRGSRNLDGSLPGAAMSVASPNGVVPLDDAVAACRMMWESGALESSDPLDPNPTPGVAPSQFTVCVTDTGAAAVVPGRIECSVLKLHPYESGD